MAITVLSMDPGTANYAASVIRVAVSDDRLKLKVLGTKIVKNTIFNPVEIADEFRAYRAEIYQLESQFGPFDLVVAERFQSRGLKGTTIESINMMLGVLATMFPSLTLYTAATWKNSFNKKFGDKDALRDLYDDLKHLVADQKKADRKTIHELDCTLMGIYHACRSLDQVPFDCLTGTKRLPSFLNHFESSLKV